MDLEMMEIRGKKNILVILSGMEKTQSYRLVTMYSIVHFVSMLAGLNI